MTADIQAMLTANQTLSKKLEKAQGEIRELYRIKERYDDLVLKYHHALKQLDIKRKVVVVRGYGEQDSETTMIAYNLQILDAIDTPEGMYIKVSLPKGSHD